MSLNPKSLQINKIVYYSIENKPILIFVKDVRCEAQTPDDLKERVRESYGTYSPRPGPEVIKLFSCSAQLRLKFILLINVKMPTIVGILTFMSRINYRHWQSLSEISTNFGYFSIYEKFKFHAQLS